MHLAELDGMVDTSILWPWAEIITCVRISLGPISVSIISVCNLWHICTWFPLIVVCYWSILSISRALKQWYDCPVPEKQPWKILVNTACEVRKLLTHCLMMDAIWRHRAESTLVQVMACCLKTPRAEPMLTCHQWGPVTFIWGQFHQK